MKKDWTFTIRIPNPFARWQHRRRIVKATDKWNSSVDYIMSEAKKTEDGSFKWSQLVWQEIWMYIGLGEQVEPSEFDTLCRRRGFTPAMRWYLQEMMIHVGLGKMLKDACWAKEEKLEAI
jgi:hypothetical protein